MKIYTWFSNSSIIFLFDAFVDMVQFCIWLDKRSFEGTNVNTKTEDGNVNSVLKFFDNSFFDALVDMVHFYIWFVVNSFEGTNAITKTKDENRHLVFKFFNNFFI